MRGHGTSEQKEHSIGGEHAVALRENPDRVAVSLEDAIEKNEVDGS